MMLVRVVQLVLTLTVVQLGDTGVPSGGGSVRVIDKCHPLYDYSRRNKTAWVEAQVLSVDTTKVLGYDHLEKKRQAELDLGDVLISIRVAEHKEDGLQLCRKYSHQGDNVLYQAKVNISQGGALPVIRLIKPTDYRVLEGQKVQLTCSATGDPTPDVYWQSLTGSIFSSLEGVPGRVTAVFSAVTLADAGDYTCRARNKAALIEQRVKLLVVPTSPSTPPVIHKSDGDVLW